jgi:uncharacterized protein YkwD
MARGRVMPAAVAAGALVLSLLSARFAPLPQPVFAGEEPGAVALPVRSPAAQVNPRLEEDVLAWLNQARASQDLPALRSDVRIQSVARAYGRRMFARGYLSHVSWNGRTLLDRLAGTGLPLEVIGENLAYAPDVGDAEQALWRSEPHRRNILYPSYRVVGIGVVDGGDDGVIVVQDFADITPVDSDAPSPPPVSPRMLPGVR